MKNFVIINGVNSNTINGLGINELPPISKPSMRVLTETIDGRDGDITTDLGYNAYDKTFTIGLFGTGYDINDIISFFNGSGTIVFSNEPDKYYKFKIIEQIDYEKLLEFKTASVRLHCQPFKYPLEEEPLEIEYEYVNGEGESITLDNTEEDVKMSIQPKGNTSQTGTPTPDTPIPINVVSGDNEIVVCGKNIFNKNGLTFKDNYYLDDNGVEQSNSAIGYTSKIKVYSNTQYTIQGTLESNDGYLRIYYFDNSQNWISRTSGISVSSIPYTFTTPNNCGYVSIQYQKSALDKDTIQLELGNQATTYEPYTSQTYPINLGTLELCKIGDYQDYFTKNSDGQWCKYNAIGKVNLNTLTWTPYAFGYGFKRYTTTGIPNVKYASVNTELVHIFAEKYREHTGSGMSSQDAEYCLAIDVSMVQAVDLEDVTPTGLLYYPLKTPYLSLIEDTNLIEQLDNIQNAMSYEGQTNVMQNNNDLAFYLIASAMKQNSNEVVVNNIGNATSKPLIALEGNGNVDIYLNDNQILQANVEDKMNIDIDTLEAYNPDTMALLNRQVTGNYNSMTLPSGNSTIKIDGNLTSATITNYTRWL